MEVLGRLLLEFDLILANQPWRILHVLRACFERNYGTTQSDLKEDIGKLMMCINFLDECALTVVTHVTAAFSYMSKDARIVQRCFGAIHSGMMNAVDPPRMLNSLVHWAGKTDMGKAVVPTSIYAFVKKILLLVHYVQKNVCDCTKYEPFFICCPTNNTVTGDLEFCPWCPIHGDTESALDCMQINQCILDVGEQDKDKYDPCGKQGPSSVCSITVTQTFDILTNSLLSVNALGEQVGSASITRKVHSPTVSCQVGSHYNKLTLGEDNYFEGSCVLGSDPNHTQRDTLGVLVPGQMYRMMDGDKIRTCISEELVQKCIDISAPHGLRTKLLSPDLDPFKEHFVMCASSKDSQFSAKQNEFLLKGRTGLIERDKYSADDSICAQMAAMVLPFYKQIDSRKEDALTPKIKETLLSKNVTQLALDAKLREVKTCTMDFNSSVYGCRQTSGQKHCDDLQRSCLCARKRSACNDSEKGL